METPTLPDGLVVADPLHHQHLAYTGKKHGAMVPVSGQEDRYDPDWDPMTSPDGRYTIHHEASLGRYVVSGAGINRPFAWYCFAPSQITWSPDSRYVAYRADDDDAKWTARIMVMRLADGHTWWIGTGESPRWVEQGQAGTSQ